METHLDNQNKPEIHSQQQKPDTQNNPIQQQQGQQKKPFRRYYNNRKRFRPHKPEQNQAPQSIQRFSFKKFSIVNP